MSLLPTHDKSMNVRSQPVKLRQETFPVVFDELVQRSRQLCQEQIIVLFLILQYILIFRVVVIIPP